MSFKLLMAVLLMIFQAIGWAGTVGPTVGRTSTDDLMASVTSNMSAQVEIALGSGGDFLETCVAYRGLSMHFVYEGDTYANSWRPNIGSEKLGMVSGSFRPEFSDQSGCRVQPEYRVENQLNDFCLFVDDVSLYVNGELKFWAMPFYVHPFSSVSSGQDGGFVRAGSADVLTMRFSLTTVEAPCS